MSQTWMFEKEEGRDRLRYDGQLALRHPGNQTEWLDDWTVKLSGEVHNQTELVLKQASAKRLD